MSVYTPISRSGGIMITKIIGLIGIRFLQSREFCWYPCRYLLQERPALMTGPDFLMEPERGMMVAAGQDFTDIKRGYRS